MNEDYEFRGVFLGVKPFDKVCAEGLVFQLKQDGTPDNLLNILENLLKGGKRLF